MVLYIVYNKSFDDNKFKLWLNHYNNTGLEYKIMINIKDVDFFTTLYPLSVSKITDHIPEKGVEITNNDFLFTYDHDDNDNIILNYNFNVKFIHDSICIGRVFYVPIKDKPDYTTFEIPDFIIYKHSKHTNYTIDGLKINGGKKYQMILLKIMSMKNLKKDI